MTDEEIDTVISILNKFQDKLHTLDLPLTTYKNLFKILTHQEVDLIRKLCGVTAQSTSDLQVVRHNLVTPDNDQHSEQFVRVSKLLNVSFEAMNKRIIKETGQELYICSGYRSPAYQSLIFLREIYLSNYDLSKAQTVAKPPLESQHCSYPFHAIDITTPSRSSQKKEISTNFEKTDAYHWMITHAGEYGFSLSYPENNQKDTIFEPWHWLYATSD
jgi:LAS superfamily LD-carboxypeptidase LdcB